MGLDFIGGKQMNQGVIGYWSLGVIGDMQRSKDYGRGGR